MNLRNAHAYRRGFLSEALSGFALNAGRCTASFSLQFLLAFNSFSAVNSHAKNTGYQ
jgi:hypothetical protein